MTEDQRWQAVLDRDARFDGAFVYAVRSTGIYCRPTCPSRRPGRRQVAFYAEPAAAEEAGFRACRRCAPGGQSPQNRQAEAVRRACAAIAAASEGPPTLAALGRAVGMSPHHLQRTFKRIMGVSPRQYADARRLGRLKSSLRKGEDIAGALYGAGYGSSSRLYEQAPGQLGMTPATYRKGGAGATMRYAIVDSALGRMLVAATERGLSFVGLGEADGELEEELREEFPAATVARDDGALGDLVGPLVARLTGQAGTLDLPLDVQATAFQRRVWEALRAIPLGEVRTYREVAESLGQPGASRAVGNACAHNPVPLVVPCHRVVRGDGGLGGYRWGPGRKEALLARERRMAEEAAP